MLDSGRGVSGVLREVLAIICRRDGVPKSRRLGYLNATVRALSKIASSNHSKKSPFTEEQNKVFDEMVSTKDKNTSPSSVDFGEKEISREHYFCL